MSQFFIGSCSTEYESVSQITWVKKHSDTEISMLEFYQIVSALMTNIYAREGKKRLKKEAGLGRWRSIVVIPSQ